MAHGWFSSSFSSWLCCGGCFLGKNVPSWLPVASLRLPKGLRHCGGERKQHPTEPRGGCPAYNLAEGCRRAVSHRCLVYPGGGALHANPPPYTCKRQ